MLTILKIAAGAAMSLAMLNPLSSPKAEDCSCNAQADAVSKTLAPQAADCSCKADAD